MTSSMADTSEATADTGAIGVLMRDTSPKNSCSPKASTYGTSHIALPIWGGGMGGGGGAGEGGGWREGGERCNKPLQQEVS